MMIGSVSRLHATVPITIKLFGNRDFSIEFIVDTGFTGFLTLPEDAVNLLHLPFIEEIPANLATNAEVYLPVHAATILWDGAEREVGVLATGKRPLLGTALLDGYELIVNFFEGGTVSATKL